MGLFRQRRRFRNREFLSKEQGIYRAEQGLAGTGDRKRLPMGGDVPFVATSTPQPWHTDAVGGVHPIAYAPTSPRLSDQTGCTAEPRRLVAVSKRHATHTVHLIKSISRATLLSGRRQ